MSSYVTQDGSQWILSCLFGQSMSPPDNYYLALCHTLPTDPGADGTTIDEPVGDVGYQRAIIANNATSWLLSGYFDVYNAVDIVFPFVPGTGGWGELTAWAMLDTFDLSTGRLLLFGTLNPPLEPPPNSKVRIRAGQLSISAASMTPSYQPS